jgi:hypothetical protein
LKEGERGGGAKGGLGWLFKGRDWRKPAESTWDKSGIHVNLPPANQKTTSPSINQNCVQARIIFVLSPCSSFIHAGGETIFFVSASRRCHVSRRPTLTVGAVCMHLGRLECLVDCPLHQQRSLFRVVDAFFGHRVSHTCFLRYVLSLDYASRLWALSTHSMPPSQAFYGHPHIISTSHNVTISVRSPFFPLSSLLSYLEFRQHCYPLSFLSYLRISLWVVFVMILRFLSPCLTSPCEQPFLLSNLNDR